MRREKYVRVPDEKILKAILGIFPSEEEQPGRWMRSEVMRLAAIKASGASEADINGHVSFMLRGPEPLLDWRGSYRSSIFTPMEGLLPYLSETQLTYLLKGWPLLSDEWQPLSMGEIGNAFFSPGGYNHFGFFKNQGIIEQLDDFDEDGNPQRRYRRGASRVVVFPGKLPENGRHLDLPPL